MQSNSMKILVLTNDLSKKNGWGRYSLDVVNALKKRGIDLTVLVHAKVEGTAIPTAVCLPKLRGYWRNYLSSFWYAWGLRKTAKKCDIIHTFMERHSLIAFFLSKMTGRKYVITVHGTYGLLPYRMFFLIRWIHHFTFKSADKIICISSYTKELLEEKGLKNLVVINNGIMYQEFASETKPFGERSDVILSVGALKYRKGQHVALEAFSGIADSFPSLKYVLVGDTDDKEYYESLKNNAIKYGVEDRVTFLSKISDNELLNLYRSSKIFVMTSITKGAHFEGFGLVYLEANANSLPVIGATGSGAEDAIKDGETGFLVPQNDAQKTAEAIKNLLSNEEHWSLMSNSAQEWAKDHDWDKIIQFYIKEYTSIYENKG